jgi:assimilatory nitrate reductase catalytic subunit
MTRTGKSPRLGAHIEEPFVEVHPEDSASAGLADGGIASVSSLHGTTVLRVRFSTDQRRGEVFAPIHWNGETASDARVGALVHQVCDPFSGQPDMKATPARIAPAVFNVQGFLLSRRKAALPDGFWWARTTIEGGSGVRFATNTQGPSLSAQARTLLGEAGAIVEFHDQTHDLYRAASIRDGRLEACVYLAAGCNALPGWDWLKRQLVAPKLDAAARKALLAGRPPAGIADTGPVVCACFGVGLAVIQDLISSGSATSVEAVGHHLKAGTNCGSCQPEIKKMIASIAGAKILATAS